MSKEPADYLKHIGEEGSHIISVSGHLSKDDFLENGVLKCI